MACVSLRFLNPRKYKFCHIPGISTVSFRKFDPHEAVNDRTIHHEGQLCWKRLLHLPDSEVDKQAFAPWGNKTCDATEEAKPEIPNNCIR